MPRGGARRGKGGATYPNRTDLSLGPRTASTQPIRVATGQPYGQALAQTQALQAVPLANVNRPPTPIPFDAPTQRPNEPVTHGLPLGPGAGSEVLGPQVSQNEDPTLEVFRELYRLYPNRDLRGLVEQAGYEG